MGMVQTTRFDSPIGELTLASTEKGLAYLGLPRANGRGFAGWQRRHAPDESVSECRQQNAKAIKQVKECEQAPKSLSNKMKDEQS